MSLEQIGSVISDSVSYTLPVQLDLRPSNEHVKRDRHIKHLTGSKSESE